VNKSPQEEKASKKIGSQNNNADVRYQQGNADIGHWRDMRSVTGPKR
jgi:hypothetical protein